VLKTCILAGLSSFIAATVVALASTSEVSLPNSELSQPLTVAIIGDQGVGDGARAVLQLIKAEGADLVLHQGDFDYRNNPGSWDAMITDALGDEFPYFASVGNHDIRRFYDSDGYQAKLTNRLNKTNGAHCIGDLGVRSACTYRGLFFILSGIGTIPKRSDDPSHVAFIEEQLAQNRSIWKICSWHRNQRKIQVGKKKDDVGWGAYEACRRGGAIIATAHEHS